MPLPEPGEGETKEQFIKRCLADDTMADEFPNVMQRYAVCQAQWLDEQEDDDSPDDDETQRAK